RDVLILSYRNVGSVAEMRAKNEGWQSPKARGESVHQKPADKLVRWFSNGQELRCDTAPSGTTRSHRQLRPASGSTWQRVSSGVGANFLRSLLQRERRVMAYGPSEKFNDILMTPFSGEERRIFARRTCCRALSDRRHWLSSAVPLDRLAPSPLRL